MSKHSGSPIARAAPVRQRPRVADFLEWDVHNWSAALEFWTRHSMQDLSGCHALEIGSRYGGLSLWLALQGATVVCSDATAPGETARRKHRAAGVSHRIRYEAIDARSIPYAGTFDVVLFKSVLGAVDGADRRAAQRTAIAEMHGALRPGGELFFAENLVASPFHRYFRRHFVAWGETWRYVSVREMRDFLAPFRSLTYETVGFAGAFGRTQVQRNALGTVDRALIDRLVPERWRYIMIGVARK